MGSVLDAIAESAYREVEAIGLHWKIGRIRSADLAKVGVAAFAVAGSGKPEDGPASLASQMTPEQAEKLAGYQEAVVCAGVKAVREGQDGTWEDVSLMISEQRSAPKEGRLWIGALPTQAVNELFSAIMDLSTDEGGAAERLASFRESA
jgi:hypothetical protein